MKKVVLFALLLAGCVGVPPAPDVVPRPLAEELATLHSMTSGALAQARAASEADSMGMLKSQVDGVFELIWGMPSGLTNTTGAAPIHGWKVRWQTTYSNFDPEFAARYGSEPPAITDPAQLGIVGRGRALRPQLLDAELLELVVMLNNVIGWTRMDDGVTKAERQPRVDLTYRWDAPKWFWQSSADTGWIFTVQAQALNILKTDYANDLDLARAHASALAALLETCLAGSDLDGDGRVSVPVESGLDELMATAGGAR